MTHPLRPLGIQAARVLEDIETLRRDYGPLIEEAEPDLWPRLGEAAEALDHVVSRTLAPRAAPGSGGSTT